MSVILILTLSDWFDVTDPTHIHPDANARGDNDPLGKLFHLLMCKHVLEYCSSYSHYIRLRHLTDVVEIGARIIPPGDIRPVKVLGILCMIDEGECDWKVVTIDANDKWAPFLNDIDDVEREMPGMLSAIREWYRTYKIRKY